MQALQFTRTLRKIIQGMKVTELVRLLEPSLGQPSNSALDQSFKDNFSILLFASGAGFDRLREDPIAEKLLLSLRVELIYAPTRLARLVNLLAPLQNSAQLHGTSEFTWFFVLLKSLADLEKSCSELLEKEKLEPAKTPDEILELELIDYDGTGIEPIRLERFVSTLIRLHTNIARIHDVKDDRLRLIYFDSGSGLLVGIQCAKVILESIRTLLDEWWDRIRFRDFENFEKRLNAVSRTLTVMGTVQQAVESKVIDEETGKLLKTRVLKEVDSLIGLGVSLPVYDDAEKVDHRKLLIEKRDTKLLGSGDQQPEPL